MKNVWLLCLCFLISCTNNVSDNNIAILPSNQMHHVFHDMTQKRYELSKEDLIKIDNILTDYINNYNNKIDTDFDELKKTIHLLPLGDSKEDCIINLKNYKRQYIPVEDIIGDKIVYINCFVKELSVKTWKEKLIIAKNGGKYIFNLKINLDENICHDFSIMEF